MKASLLFTAVAILSIAPANAGPNPPDDSVRDPGIKAKLMDPDIRRFAPTNASSYQDCQDKLRATGVGPNYQWAVCSAMGYKR